MKDTIYHRILKRPYKLNFTIYDQGEIPVVFLHGINSNINNWQYVMPHLSDIIKPILIDLIGFGGSSKPKWPNYDINFHTKQIEYTLRKIGYNRNIIIAGHSMGGLIAIQLAKNNPELCKQLVLINTPIYATEQIKSELAKTNKSKIKATNILFTIYQKLLNDKNLTLKGASKIIKYMPKDSAFNLNQDNWLSFEKSLKNTIMNQKSIKDLQALKIPIYFMNGITDILTINKNQANLAASQENIQLDYLPSGHMINKLSGKKIAKKINIIASI